VTTSAYEATLTTTFEVGPGDAADVLAMIRAAFGSREVLDPPSTALSETESSVAAALAEHGGLLARSRDGDPLGALLFDPLDEMLGLRRVSVHPDVQGHGVARALVRGAEGHAVQHGYDAVRLLARAELPRTVRFWEHAGYVVTDRDGVFLTMARELPVTVTASTPSDTADVGRRLAGVLRAGDLLTLNGSLGAGKTTLTQGLGEGLRVRGAVTSPTFVIARVHPPLGSGPGLVHVDAYRLERPADSGKSVLSELDDLDLDASLDESVTVVEWGAEIAEALTEDRLDVTLSRDDDSEVRTITITPVGRRWLGSGLRAALA